MIAVDTNILAYSVRRDSPWHEPALAAVKNLAESGTPWVIPWPCVHEFIAIVTHPRLYDPPTPLEDALRQVEYWMESPALRIAGEAPGYWERFRETAARAKAAGPIIHDVRVASICLSNGVREIWTADRDFLRFGQLRARNPLLDPAES